MEKNNDTVPVQATECREAVIDTSGFSLEAVRALARRHRMPGRSHPTAFGLPLTALMGCR